MCIISSKCQFCKIQQQEICMKEKDTAPLSNSAFERSVHEMERSYLSIRVYQLRNYWTDLD
jgi:hypothetical protein